MSEQREFRGSTDLCEPGQPSSLTEIVARQIEADQAKAVRAVAPADPRHRGIPLQRFAPKGFRHEVEQARRYPKPPVAELLSHAPDLDGLEWAFRLALEGSEHASRGTKRKWTERALRKAWALAGTEEALYRIVRIAGEAGVDVGTLAKEVR